MDLCIGQEVTLTPKTAAVRERVKRIECEVGAKNLIRKGPVMVWIVKEFSGATPEESTGVRVEPMLRGPNIASCKLKKDVWVSFKDDESYVIKKAI